MVTAARKEVLRKDSIHQESSTASNKRKTRGTTKVNDSEEANITNKETDIPTKSGCRKKTVPKDKDRVISTKGKRKEKTVSPTVVDVVLGKVQRFVADLEELRRKREEDTVKCGRVVRSIAKIVNTTTVPSNSVTDSEENAPQTCQEEESTHETPNHSPNLSANANSAGGLLWSLTLQLTITIKIPTLSYTYFLSFN